MSEAVTSTKSGGVIDRFIGEHHHDEGIDLDTEISSRQAAVLLWRCLKLLGGVRRVFAAKFLLQPRNRVPRAAVALDREDRDRQTSCCKNPSARAKPPFRPS